MVPGLLALAALPLIAVAAIGNGLIVAGEWAVEKYRSFKQRKRARLEAELDRKQLELRATILRLASELGADAHEARKAMIRESYLATGRTTPPE